jgi:hypothetical protein
MQIVTSKTGSPLVNRASHVVKVSIAALAAKALITRFGINRTLLLGSLAASALAYPAISYTYSAISSVKKDHSSFPYNRVLYRIWGAPGRASTRTTFPLITGVQMVLLAQGLRFLPPSRLLQGGVVAVACFPQARALWGVLSVPPSEAWGGAGLWVGERRRATRIMP